MFNKCKTATAHTHFFSGLNFLSGCRKKQDDPANRDSLDLQNVLDFEPEAKDIPEACINDAVERDMVSALLRNPEKDPIIQAQKAAVAVNKPGVSVTQAKKLNSQPVDKTADPLRKWLFR